MARTCWKEIFDLQTPVDEPRGGRPAERSRRKKVRQLLTRRPAARG